MRRRLQRKLRRSLHGKFAGPWRRRLTRTTFIAVTGSCGKTTTVALLDALLSNKGSIHTGVHLNTRNAVNATILRVRPWHRWCLQEISGHAPGQIAAPGRDPEAACWHRNGCWDRPHQKVWIPRCDSRGEGRTDRKPSNGWAGNSQCRRRARARDATAVNGAGRDLRAGSQSRPPGVLGCSRMATEAHPKHRLAR
jgi:hypothetical protein